MHPAIEIDSLQYTYRSDFLVRRIKALRGISLSVAQGEAFGYLGPNGAGKTTTIKCILGLIRPSTGRVLVGGAVAGSREARRQLGYLAEQPYFYDYLTVQETMELFATLTGLIRSARKAAIDTVLERVGMAERRGSKMRSLSKGLTQRIALAQALVARPQIVILDEPFSGLDPIGRREFREIFLELKRNGTTLFMSSHVLSDVEYLCDRASITVKGELKTIVDLRSRGHSIDDFEIVTSSPLGPDIVATLPSCAAKTVENRTELLVRGQGPTQEVLRMLLAKNIVVARVEQRQPSLEDLFINIVSAK